MKKNQKMRVVQRLLILVRILLSAKPKLFFRCVFLLNAFFNITFPCIALGLRTRRMRERGGGAEAQAEIASRDQRMLDLLK